MSVFSGRAHLSLSEKLWTKEFSECCLATRNVDPKIGAFRFSTTTKGENIIHGKLNCPHLFLKHQVSNVSVIPKQLKLFYKVHVKVLLCIINFFFYSELHTPYGIDCDEPFIAEPTEGIIAPFGTTTITCTFKPKSACVFEATCVVKYGANFAHAKTTRFEGIGMCCC